MEMESFKVKPAMRLPCQGWPPCPLTPDARQRMGLTLGKVQSGPWRAISGLPRGLSRNETRLFRVTTKVEGWVDKLFRFGNRTGGA